MLLRTSVHGQPFDLRAHGQWGIGAEILLHAHPRSHPVPATPPGALFTPEGFQRAREYYQCLVVQHPHHRHVRNVVDELTFYPAMFSLWVLEACESTTHALRQIDHARKSVSDDALHEEEPSAHSLAALARQERDVRDQALRLAREIADCLDALVCSPPMDKHADLLQLRGMISLWIGDLIVGDHDVKYEEDHGREESEHDEGGRTAQRRVQIQQASDFFHRARANGGRVWDGASNFVAEARR